MSHSPGRIGSLYVHVPFCLSLCPYCDFVVYAGGPATEWGGRLDAFERALLAELKLRADALPARARPAGGLDTVYLGGGTPSLLGPRRVARLLDAVDRWLGIGPGAEVTLEVNPGPRDRGDPRAFVAAGVTRLSIGAQSLLPVELRSLGRRHTPSDVGDAVREARAAGARSVSLDLLYDIPGQTLASWSATLDQALALQPDHVSTYALSLDDPAAEGLTGPTGDHLAVRPGARRWRERARAAQDAAQAARMYELADERFTNAGLLWYELSNWARPEHRSRHNLAYWRREPYLALGPGAHGFDGRLRWWNAARLAGYLAALCGGPCPTLPPGGSEIVAGRTATSEIAMLGLRLAEGLAPAAVARLSRDASLAEAFAWGRAAGLLEGRGNPRSGSQSETPLVLTMRGRLLADELFVRLV